MRNFILTPINGISALTMLFSAGRLQKKTSSLLILLALATLLPSLASGYDVLILQSRRDPAYEEVLKAFLVANNASKRTIVLSDYADVDVTRIVREDQPRVILTIGDAALTAARRSGQKPVVAAMALGIHNRKASHNNLTGVGMFAHPDRYMNIFKAMKIRRVGVIYSPAKSDWYMGLARHAAKDAGIELVIQTVAKPTETIDKLTKLSGKVDALWMLPDNTAVTRETTEAYFRFGQQQAVPVVSFATAYLGLGAAVVVDLDWQAIGRQAGTTIAALLRGSSLDGIPLSFPSNTTVNINPSVLKRLNSSLTMADFQLQ